MAFIVLNGVVKGGNPENVSKYFAEAIIWMFFLYYLALAP